MNLNKKTMTKLLNLDYRRSILDSYKVDDYKIFEYARYVVDNQIISRNITHKDDKKSYYGFLPLNILCCVKKNKEIEKQFFEFNIVNHFLKNYDGNSAVEVVACILILWLKSDKKNIESFDYIEIDKALTELEKQYMKTEEDSTLSCELSST